MPQHLRPSPGLLGGGERPGRKVGACNAIPSISAGMVGARAKDLDFRADSARNVSLSNRGPSHRPARALEAAAWLGKMMCGRCRNFPLGQVQFL